MSVEKIGIGHWRLTGIHSWLAFLFWAGVLGAVGYCVHRMDATEREKGFFWGIAFVRVADFIQSLFRKGGAL